MSSSTWTRAELSSSARALSGGCWRFVEAQHHVSTVKITDTLEEQKQLEALLEADKPPIPEECRALHYLLFTPFRYGAAYPHGSRFRRAGLTPGVFYASETARTAAIETAFHRLLFFAESPDTPWPANPGEYTAFRAEYATARAVDLIAPPLHKHSAIWMHPTSYEACQQLAEACRNEDIDVIKYQSVRDPAPSANFAILRCRVFVNRQPTERQTWRIQLSSTGARIICEYPKMAFDLDRTVFAGDPRTAVLPWER
jgi:RES domain-containing protein